jgi:hypothetical protein
MYDDSPVRATREEAVLLLENLQNGLGYFIENGETDTDDEVHLFVKFDRADLVTLNHNSALFHVVVLTQRACAQAFGEELEHTHFPVGTPLNEEFQVRHFAWQDGLWTIFSVPVAKANLAYVAASAVGARLADGVPTLIDMGLVRGQGSMRKAPEVFQGVPVQSVKVFPLCGKNVFTLEPMHSEKGPVMAAIIKTQDRGEEGKLNWIHKLKGRRAT